MTVTRRRGWRGFVPGRLEVFGKHTDYAGGRTLVAAIPRGLSVSADPRDDRIVTVLDSATTEVASFDARTAAGDADGWGRYAATVIRRLRANFPDAELSARISFSSTLPQAAGMSSSSALVIALAESLIACAGIEELPAWREAIQSQEDRASYFGCIENGSPFRSLAGNEGVGTHGGSEDHAAILLSRAGHLQMFAFRPLRRERIIRMPPDVTFVIAWSGVRAEKTGAARLAYNRLADPAAMTGNRLDHLRAEDARVVEAAEAFAHGNLARIGVLAAESQHDADRWLGNQVPETRHLVSLALANGAAAASSFGAGWGGSVWALTSAGNAGAFADRWLAAYRARYPDRASGAFAAFPAAGASEILPG